MDEECTVFQKLLMMLVVVGDKKGNSEKEWKKLHDWYTTFRKSKRCNVLSDGDICWTIKELKEKDRLWLTLRECLLNQQWKDALDVLIVIADTPLYASAYTILRVGMELIHQMGLGSEMFEELIDASKITNSGIIKKEMCIDKFLFSLATKFSSGLDTSKHNLQMFGELTKQFKERIARSGYTRFYDSPSEKLNCILFDDVYYGLASYAKWLLTKIELEGMQGGEERDKLIEILTLQFKEATEHISRGAEEDGNWSSFIGKVVEMIEYQAVVEDNRELVLQAELVVTIYMKKHQNDLVTKKILYSLYQKHSDIFHIDKKNAVLREIVALCPSDPLVLKLVMVEKKETKKLRLLFTFLTDNKDHLKAWMMLIPILQDNLTAPGKQQSILSCLKSLVEQEEIHSSMFYLSRHCTVPGELVILKSCVACLLFGRSCAMYTAVRKLIQHSTTKPALCNLFKSVKKSSWQLEI